MQVAGIIAEYNPFHNGHFYQISKTKQETNCDYIIVVMSGNFSQRGTATIADKFTRTQMALASGVDLVLELPVPFATASAERFAQGAISLLNKSGCVQTLSFGSEAGTLDLLKTIAQCLRSPSEAFEDTLKSQLRLGLSFPRAREKAIIAELEALNLSPNLHAQLPTLISSPNNILGIEYIKAIEHYHSPITPFTVKRLKANYHDTEVQSSIASATALRHCCLSGETQKVIHCIPEASYEYLKPNLQHLPHMDTLSAFLHYKFMFSNKEDLYSIWDIPKDLIHSFVNTYKEAKNFSELVQLNTSKTYTTATVQRALLRILLDIQADTMMNLEKLDWIPYIRVLGCKKSATPLLKRLTESSALPVITNVNKIYPSLSPEAQSLLNYEFSATKLYHYILGQPHLYAQDFTQGFLMLP